MVKTGCDGIKLKPKIKINPIIKLRNFIEKHQIKLIDFFNKFDKDGSMSVSRDEFREGILELGIRFNQEEIDQLINELDPDGDGEINYRYFFSFNLILLLLNKRPKFIFMIKSDFQLKIFNYQDRVLFYHFKVLDLKFKI